MDVRTRVVLCFAAILILASLPHLQPVAAAPDASSADGTVTGTGTATIERAPNLLRMQVELMTTGKDMKDALSKLRTMEADARKKLAALGAAESSITVGAPRDPSNKSPRQQQMEALMRMQMGRGKKPTTVPTPAITLALPLKAEWPLSGSGDELIVKAAELVEKIKSADVAGKKNAATALTPEQQEELEEQQGLAQQAEAMAGGEGGGAGSPSEARFSYVATLTDQEQSKAVAQAFEKAKADAARLAKASGADLGGLKQLSSQRTPLTDAQAGNEMANYYMTLMNGGRAVNVDDTAEAVGSQSASVGVKVTVTASFSLK